MRLALGAALLVLTGSLASAEGLRVIEGTDYSVTKDVEGRCTNAIATAALPGWVRCQDNALLWRQDELQWYKATNFVTGTSWSPISFGGAPSFPLLAPDGSAAAPSYSFSSGPTGGIYFDPTASDTIVFKGTSPTGTDQIGSDTLVLGGVGTGAGAGGFVLGQVALPSTSGATPNTPQYFLLVSGSSGKVEIGNLNAISPAGSFFVGVNRATGQTDGVGGPTQFGGGSGTGLGAGGDSTISAAPPGLASGSSQNAGQIGFMLSGADGSLTLGGLNVFGTPGTSTWAGADRAAGVMDGVGGNTVIDSGVGTGAAAATTTSFRTPTVGGSGTGQQALATRLTVATAGVTATVPVTSSTDNLGWSIVSAANQACTTTCTNAAVFGFDGTTPVGPTNALADTCVCAGAN